MKLALAIICSLMLAGVPFLSAQTASAACRAKAPVPVCCQHGGKMPCCAANPVPNSQPSPAVPAPAAGQNQLSFLAANVVAWVLPEAASSQVSFVVPVSLMTKASPLFARNCAWLI
ncbi:MAG TPA: hypothetical protein VIK53_14740 [Verrucomicrobiae bacterium]